MLHFLRSRATSKRPIAPVLSLILLLGTIMGTAAGAAWLPIQTRHSILSHLLLSRVHEAFLLERRSPVRLIADSITDLPPLAPDARITTRANARQAVLSFTVTSTADFPDAKVGDGVCQTTTKDGANCTLRAAIQEANANGGGAIGFNLPGAGDKTIALTGALPNLANTLSIVNAQNTALTVSGGNSFRIFRTAIGSKITLGNLLLSGGKADGAAIDAKSGGAIYNDNAQLSLSDCTLSGNTATFGGGALYALGSIGDSDVTLLRCTFSNNTSGGAGGAIANEAGASRSADMGLTRCVLNGNSAGQSAGGAAANNGGDLRFTECSLLGNSAFNGGAINNSSLNRDGTLRVIRSTLANNSAKGAGGAIFNRGDASGGGVITALAVISNSTFSGNAATGESGGNGDGGALANTSFNGTGELQVDSCTFARNNATRGASISNSSPQTQRPAKTSLQNSLFLRGATTPNFSNGAPGVGGDANSTFGNINTLGYNGCDDSNNFLIQPTDRQNRDLKLGDLADNGGPTQTVALGTGSPAIDAGFTDASTDQRGVARPQGSADDIGAFEFGSATPTATPTTAPTATATATATPTAAPTATPTATPSGACSLVVSNLSDSGDGSLRAAVGCSNSTSGAQTVSFAAGLTGTITLTSGQIAVSDSATISGPGQSVLSVSGNNASRIFNIAGGLTTSIENLTLSNGKTSGVQGDPTFGRGGAIYNAVGATTTGSARGAAATSSLTLTHVTLSNNQARNALGFGSDGGAVFGETVSLANCTLSGNATDDEGGGVFGTTVSISDSTLSGNTANFAGGGASSSTSLTIDNSAVRNNTAAVAGGIYGLNASISNSSISDNNATASSGGGINLIGTGTISGSTVSGNTSKKDGGGIYLNKPATFTNSRVTGNRTTEGRGGGLFSEYALQLTDCTISGNTSPVFGGGIYNIGADAAATVTNSTLSGNTTGSRGGGFYGASANFINSTVSGNTGGELGGGLHAERLALTGCSVTGNTARKSGVTSRAGGVLVVTQASIGNSIIAGNIADELADFTAFGDELNSRGYNIIGSTDFSFDKQGDRTGLDPKLGPLADNGGPTLTHAPLAGSPAIDAGNPDTSDLPATDQRGPGFARVSGGRVDIGALETQLTTPVKIDTSTVLASSLNPSTAGQNVSFTATVAASAVAAGKRAAASVPTGNVSFKDGAIPLGTVALDVTGKATFSTLTLSAGTHLISAIYEGDANFNGSTSALSQVVNAAPTLPALSISDVSISEGNSGQKNATFSVSLSSASAVPVSVSYATADGTATQPGDYLARSGTLSFAASQKTLKISVPIIGDTTREANETFLINLSNPSGATISDAQGVGTISNDDRAFDLQITQNAAPNPIPVGARATFTLQIKNSGPDAAQNVVVTDTLPGGATFIEAKGATFTRNGATVTFTLGTLGSGATRTLSVVVSAPNVAGTLVNSVKISGNGAPDANAGNNQSNASVPTFAGPQNVSAQTAVSLSKVTSVGAYLPNLYGSGAHLVQTVTLRNKGVALSGPLYLMLDELPAKVELVNRSGATTLAPSGAVYIAVPIGSDGLFSAGESVRVRLEFRLKAGVRPSFTPRVMAGPGTP